MKRYRNFNFICGMVFLGITVVLVLCGLIHTPMDPNAMSVTEKNMAPSLSHLFGTDNYGRDILSRVMVGAKTTFLIGAATIIFGGIVGTVLGALTAYFGGWFDIVVMRVCDSLLAFPSILLALVFVGIFGTGQRNVVLALGILFVPSIARVVRSEMLKQLQMDYVANARLMGASKLRVIFVHVLPNIRATLLVTMAVGFNNAVLAEAGLSYLGLGVQPPHASLGRMLSDGQSYIRLAPWSVIFPGVALVLAVLGISLLSDAFSGNQGDNGNPVWKRKRLSRLLREKYGMTNATESSIEAQATTVETEPKNDFVLSVSDLHVAFEGEDGGCKEVVRGVSFRVATGECLGIVGESGSGKSMSALSVMRLLPEAAGYCGRILLHLPEGIVDLASVDSRRLSELRGTEVAMVFQEPMSSLNPSMTIERQMDEMLTHGQEKLPKEQRRARIAEALLEVELDETERIMKSLPKQLSGGQRQRVMIAMAMLNRPRLLIADELTTALDAETREQILALLRRLQEKYGMALLFISHELEIVERFCQRVVVLNEGRVVEQGAVSEVFRNPKEAYTKELLKAMNGECFKERMAFPEKPEVILRVQHLHVYYGKRRSRKPFSYTTKVLEDYSTTMYRGDVLGIVGRSGSGKSTLAKCLTGMLKPQVGRIVTDACIGMVFQDPYGSLNPAKTVEWLLREPLRNQGVSKEEQKKQAVEMLAAIDLPPEYAGRKISELSGGQRQRVAIGIAMMSRPEILILDEPVSALDPTVQEQILALLADFHDRFGLTYLFITHDRQVMERMANRVEVWE